MRFVAWTWTWTAVGARSGRTSMTSLTGPEYIIAKLGFFDHEVTLVNQWCVQYGGYIGRHVC